MRTDQKIKFLTWAVVILAVLNLSIITTIVYHVQTEKNQMKGRKESSPGSFSGKEIMKVIGFNQEQSGQFYSANDSFRESVRNINYALDENRNSLFAEIRKSKVDTSRCDLISAEIGELHKTLKIKTYRFYLDVKKICTPEQQMRLNEMFAPLFSEENGSGSKHGKGEHHREH